MLMLATRIQVYLSTRTSTTGANSAVSKQSYSFNLNNKHVTSLIDCTQNNKIRMRPRSLKQKETTKKASYFNFNIADTF